MEHTDPHRPPGAHDRTSRPTVHVLVPDHPEYDCAEYRADVTGWCDALGLPWTWRAITLAGVDEGVSAAAAAGGVVLNLCDGDELDGQPGLAVVEALERSGAVYTGADPAFYAVSSSKRAMRERLAAAGVPVAPADGFPQLVKLDIGAEGLGLTRSSVVADPAARDAAVARARRDHPRRGVVTERFIDGPEHTVLVVGGRACPPLTFVFPTEQPPRERILFAGRHDWGCELAPAHECDELQALARDAFEAVGGVGYGRVDIRRDAMTGELFVLEVNANCALATAEPTIGATGVPLPEILRRILAAADARAAKRVA